MRHIVSASWCVKHLHASPFPGTRQVPSLHVFTSYLLCSFHESRHLLSCLLAGCSALAGSTCEFTASAFLLRSVCVCLCLDCPGLLFVSHIHFLQTLHLTLSQVDFLASPSGLCGWLLRRQALCFLAFMMRCCGLQRQAGYLLLFTGHLCSQLSGFPSGLRVPLCFICCVS